MVTSSLAEIQLREMCLFSHLRLESSQPVEKGHIQHFSGRDKIHSRSTWERGKFCSWKYLEMSKIFMRRGDQVTETACDGETEITSDTLMSDREKKLRYSHPLQMEMCGKWAVLAAISVLKCTSGVKKYEPVQVLFPLYPCLQHL